MGTVVDRTGPFSGQLWNAGCVREDNVTLATEGPFVPARTQLIYDGVEYQPTADTTDPASPQGISPLNQALFLFQPYIVRWRDCVTTALNMPGVDVATSGFRPLAANPGEEWVLPPTPDVPEPPGPEGDRPEEAGATGIKAPSKKAWDARVKSVGLVEYEVEEHPAPLPEGGQVDAVAAPQTTGKGGKKP